MRSRFANFMAAGLVMSLAFASVLSLPAQASESCGGVKTSYIKCTTSDKPTEIEDTSFWWLMEFILNILLGVVGIAAIGGIIWGAVLYASAADNESQTQHAKELIRNVVIGLVLFISMYAILQYLIPGGVFA